MQLVFDKGGETYPHALCITKTSMLPLSLLSFNTILVLNHKQGRSSKQYQPKQDKARDILQSSQNVQYMSGIMQHTVTLVK